MESNTLGTFIVKRRKVLLPVLENCERYCEKTF